MSKKDFDLDEEVERLSRRTNINIRKSEYSFDNQLRKLDNDIDMAADKNVKEFDEKKSLTLKYLSTDYTDDTINRYKEKLKKI